MKPVNHCTNGRRVESHDALNRVKKFTLIEMLVAITIISILASMLLPSLRRTMEQGRRVACANNLKQWGLISTMIALDYDDTMPYTFGGDNGTMFYPSFTRWSPSGVIDENYYMGTQWETYEEYGAVDELRTCPSADYWIDSWVENVGWGWGSFVGSNYLLLSNSQDRFGDGDSRRRWEMEPAQTLSDDNPTERIVVADSVYYGGGGAWGDTYRINHLAGDDFTPDVQLRIFLDGHVDVEVGLYDGWTPFDGAPGFDVSAIHDWNGGYFFWEGNKNN